MPTTPLENVLNRDLSRVAAKEAIDLATPLLQELIHFGTHALRRCQPTNADELTSLAPLGLYLHILEMTDGIEVLIAQSCVAPAAPLLRSIFEASLSLEFILQADFEQRSLACLASDLLDRKSANERFDPTSRPGHDFQQAANDDPIARAVLPKMTALQTKAAEKAASYQALLDRTEFQPVLLGFKNAKKRHPKWYGINNGPENLRLLAQHLHREGEYLLLYSHWSSITHAEDHERFTRRDAHPDPTVRLIRDHSGLQLLTGFTASFLLRATRQLLDHYRHSESLEDWYTNEIRDRFWALNFADMRAAGLI